MKHFINIKRSVRRAVIAATALATIAGTAIIGLGTSSAMTFNNGGAGCSVEGLMPLRSAFNVSGSIATTMVQVDGPASCRETVTLSSWNAPQGSANLRPFQNQQFFTSRTFVLGPGQHSLSVRVNNSCSFQVDVLLGSNPRSAAGDANFSPDQVIGFLLVSGAACPAPTPAPTPPAPTPAPTPPATTTTTNNVCSGSTSNTSNGAASQGGNCSTNTTIVQAQATQNTGGSGGSGGGSSSSSATSSASAGPASATVSASAPAATATETATTPVATTTAAPTSLVNTGPGSIAAVAAIFGLVTVAGTLLYHHLLKRRVEAL